MKRIKTSYFKYLGKLKLDLKRRRFGLLFVLILIKMLCFDFKRIQTLTIRCVCLSLASLLLGSCGSNPKPEEDCGFVQNVYGQRVSWKQNLPIHLYVDANYPTEHQDSLNKAVESWEKTMKTKLFEVHYSTVALGKPAQDGSNNIYWLTTWESNKSTEQARTSVYWVGNQIKEADLRINAKDFNFYDSAANNNRDVHLESLLIHELGHVLGLKHKDVDASVMQTYLSSLTVRDQVSDVDKTNLTCEY